jgi:hypothetical protein
MRKFMLADLACLAVSGCMSAEDTAPKVAVADSSRAYVWTFRATI